MTTAGQTDNYTLSDHIKAINEHAGKGVIKYCNFTGNTANGINSCGGAVYWSGIDGICIDSNFVNGNASKGGSIYWDGNNGSIDNCSFKNNQAYLGLIYE